mmetsp:Transcript_26359/g.72789  ORF Transcript_26359/g.72789 Transcript_26359/m.72789 type:complete len:86 (-) Transcript_26359:313-570(-)
MKYFAALLLLLVASIDAKQRGLDAATKLKALCKKRKYYLNNKAKCNKFLMMMTAPTTSAPAYYPSPTTSAPAASMTSAPASGTYY